ncbi:hypothetical protein [Streptomyces sp. S.PB5]|uniref:hypothetical protein n=1 Tax=Streptomyces sp. S.PB5 TaxID=3020844 RepID=UPI0025B11D79|nr:hypothetical protein [Streptomyces sp. S.PB5]MDN3026528.1 hypothetical protein [Streptomyces sp. S.PB5]
MRGKARRTWTAGLATVALAAGLAACTGSSGDGGKDGSGDKTSAKPVAKACANGTFTWFDVEKSDRLTGVSDLHPLPEGVTMTSHMERVYTPRASVKTQGPALSPAEVLFSLGKKIGEIDSDAPTLAAAGGDTWAFTDVNGKAPSLDSGIVGGDNAGDFVTYAGVREVTADFQYSCPDGTATTGQARQWTVDIGGVLSCDEAVDTDDLARQAARRSCEAGAVATRDAA